MAGIYGSKRAARFISDAFYGIESVDVVCLGDSNIAYPSNEGYAGNISEAFWSLGGTIYGGPVVIPGGYPNPISMTVQEDVGCTIYPGRLNGQSGGVTWMLPGEIDGTPAIKELMRYGYGTAVSGGSGGVAPLRQGGSSNNTFIVGDDGGTNDRQASFDYKITAAGAIGVKDEFLYRVKYGTVNSSPSLFSLTAYTGNNTVITTEQVNGQGPSVSELRTASITVPANDNRNLDLRFSKCGTQVAVPGLGLYGVAQWCTESVTKVNVKGMAVSILHYGSGYQTAGISNALTEGRAQAKVLIGEIYERSIAAGNNGRLLFFTNTATNGPDTTATWTRYTDEIITKVLDICDELKIDRQKIAFLTSVTQPVATPDSFASIRTAARKWATARNEDNVTFFDHSDLMNFTDMNSAGWIHATINHMTDIGYLEVSKIMLTNLLDYAKENMANTIATINPMSTVSAYAPDFRGEANNQYTTPVLAASSSVTLPAIETFPAIFLISQEADSAANSRCGFIVAHSASKISANGGQNVSTTAGAQVIVPTISSGVVTLTSNATFGAVAGGKGVTVIRIK